MQNSCIFIFLLILILVQTILSFEMITDDQDENKFDDIRQISSLPYYSSISSGLLSNGKQENGPECLSKNLFLNILSRDRRASISRLFFNHWRGSRDNSRYIPKNLLAFSPRLGKRAYEDDNEFNVPINKQQVEEDNGTPDLDTFLVTLIGHLQRKKTDIVYEDSTKLCLSEAVNDGSIKEVLDKFYINRRQQEEQYKEEARERHSKGKHPLLFRYRLG